MPKDLTLEQRLDVIRKADHLRKWDSLDNERICIVCERVFSGNEIRISRDQRGRYLLQCPTQGCPSFVGHWFYVGARPNPAPLRRINRQHQIRSVAA